MADERNAVLSGGSRPVKNRKASALTHQDAEKLHSDVAKLRGEYAANRAIQLARAIYNKAKTWKMFSGENPFTGITLFKERPRERSLTDDEAVRILKALQQEQNTDLRDFLLLDICTGVRKSNVLSMKWEDIDLKQGRWSIPDTKNGSSQIVWLNALEISILRHRQNKQDKSDIEAIRAICLCISGHWKIQTFDGSQTFMDNVPETNRPLVGRQENKHHHPRSAAQSGSGNG